jgi:hypothetical protein
LKLVAKGIKRSADFKGANSCVKQKGEKFTEKLIFRDLNNLAKNVFGKIFRNFLTQEL